MKTPQHNKSTKPRTQSKQTPKDSKHKNAKKRDTIKDSAPKNKRVQNLTMQNQAAKKNQQHAPQDSQKRQKQQRQQMNPTCHSEFEQSENEESFLSYTKEKFNSDLIPTKEEFASAQYDKSMNLDSRPTPQIPPKKWQQTHESKPNLKPHTTPKTTNPSFHTTHKDSSLATQVQNDKTRESINPAAPKDSQKRQDLSGSKDSQGLNISRSIKDSQCSKKSRGIKDSQEAKASQYCKTSQDSHNMSESDKPQDSHNTSKSNKPKDSHKPKNFQDKQDSQKQQTSQNSQDSKDLKDSQEGDTPQERNIYSYLLEELEQIITPKFRAQQIYHWLYRHYVSSAQSMRNLPKDMQDFITTHFDFPNLTPVCIESSQDGTKKYLFQTRDGFTFESVFIVMRQKEYDNNGRVIKGEKYTFCVSSQVGCRVGCAFCSTAKGGFVRNLEAGEIVEQVVALKRDNNLAAHKSINIVFMGMGEPLDNLSNVAKAIRILSHNEGLCIATRRQTISTSGIAPQIEKLGKLNLGVQIALSLHAVDDSLRSALIPMNKVYNIERVLQALRQFPLDTRKRILFEYLVIKDMNDDLSSAKKLVKLLHGFKAKVNLIPFNPHQESSFERPSMQALEEFANYLYKRGIVATIRESKGIDISAACGQLRAKHAKDPKSKAAIPTTDML